MGTSLWQPRGFGALIGWVAFVSLAIYFLHDQMVQAGFFGESCRTYGLDSWSCGVIPNFVVWLPNMFVYFLRLPFNYDSSADLIGAGFMFMALGSGVAYILALVAVNYWIWKLNTL
jgi:hypothetical protein